MDTRDAYGELGLAPGASENEVKVAWRRLVSQWHPDRNTGADALARMQRINQAYEDIRLAGYAAPIGRPRSAADAPRDDAPAKPPARTIGRKVRLTLEEAALGCIKRLRGTLIDDCATCCGSGQQSRASTCPSCAGSGSLRRRPWFSWLAVAEECEACQGQGSVHLRCPSCDGSGKARAHRYEVAVRFPAGVRDADLLQVDARRSGRAAGLAFEIRIQVAPHEFLVLDADGTVHCEVPVDGFAWIGNRSIDVPTVGGPCSLALSRERVTYRLRGQGFPVERRGARGDQVVHVVPTFPQRFSAEQAALLDRLIASTSALGRAKADGRLADWARRRQAWERAQRKRSDDAEAADEGA